MPALGPPGALSPNDWGAQVDYDEWRDLFSPDDGVAAHHGGGSDYLAGRPPFYRAKEIAQLQSWEQSHLNKGWRGLAYGWAIGQTGTIYRIRGWARYGAHTGDVDGDGIANNDEIVPFIIIGSGHHHTLSPEAEAAIVRLRRFIEEGSPDATYLYGHQELKGIVTSCPGPNFMAYVRNHRLLEADMPLTDEDIRKIWAFPTLTSGVTSQLALTRAERGVNALLLRDTTDPQTLADLILENLDDGLAREVADELGRRLRG